MGRREYYERAAEPETGSTSYNLEQELLLTLWMFGSSISIVTASGMIIYRSDLN
jgi:hypothetical protein